MKILHLTLKKKWFDMIASGEKPEEYRDIKFHWISRLTKNFSSDVDKYSMKIRANQNVLNKGSFDPKQFDVVRFTNGYKKNAPFFDIELKNMSIDIGLRQWGAEPNKLYFVLQLGNVIVPVNS